MNQMNIGNFLKQLRKDRGLTQAQLAAAKRRLAGKNNPHP